MKIYFAAPLQGNISKRIELYNEIIQRLSSYGKVLTEKIGNKKFQIERKKKDILPEKIHDYDIRLLSEAKAVVAEVTIPSLGVGYEIGRTIENKKPVLCLYNENIITLKNISNMIRGCPTIKVCGYRDLKDISLAIKSFFESI